MWDWQVGREVAGWLEYLEILAFFGWSGFEFWLEPFLFFESAIGQKDVDHREER